MQERQSSYQKEYYHEKMSRKVKAETKDLKAQQGRERAQENETAQDQVHVQAQAHAQANKHKEESQHEEALRVPDRTRSPSLKEPALTG